VPTSPRVMKGNQISSLQLGGLGGGSPSDIKKETLPLLGTERRGGGRVGEPGGSEKMTESALRENDVVWGGVTRPEYSSRGAPIGKERPLLYKKGEGVLNARKRGRPHSPKGTPASSSLRENRVPPKRARSYVKRVLRRSAEKEQRVVAGRLLEKDTLGRARRRKRKGRVWRPTRCVRHHHLRWGRWPSEGLTGSSGRRRVCRCTT